MNPALASLLALFLAIVLSMVTRLNVGLVAMALAWVVGVYLAGLKIDTVIAGFPSNLFLTLTGVTLLFACAEVNQTLEHLAHRAVRLVRGNRRLLPLLFFMIAFVLSTVGPGAISSVALIVPLAMVIGEQSGTPRFLTALMVANGANAGNLSPISSVGLIANNKMAESGLGGNEWKVWLANFIAHAIVALVAYFWLVSKSERDRSDADVNIATETKLSKQQIATLVLILSWIGCVLFLKINLGLSAFFVASILIIIKAADETQALRKVPWGVIIMVSGVSLLVALLEKTGGMEHFTSLLARAASPQSINGMIAFITGVISSYSSTSGVVLPAFLPTAPKLVAELGGGDALAIALSINVGSSIVDVSPLSTLGALCIAAVSDGVAAKKLFQQLLFWGLAMTVVGALLCQFFIGFIARA